MEQKFVRVFTDVQERTIKSTMKEYAEFFQRKVALSDLLYTIKETHPEYSEIKAQYDDINERYLRTHGFLRGYVRCVNPLFDIDVVYENQVYYVIVYSQEVMEETKNVLFRQFIPGKISE